MSSTSGVSSTSSQYETQAANQNNYAQVSKNFQAIGTALQSGDLSSAQSALSTFQQSLPSNSQASSNQPFGKNSQANSDFQSLVSALNSGNTTTAQQAYTSLQNDLKSTQSAHRGHHHHKAASATAAEATAATTSPTSSTADTDETNSDSLLNVTA